MIATWWQVTPRLPRRNIEATTKSPRSNLDPSTWLVIFLEGTYSRYLSRQLGKDVAP